MNKLKCYFREVDRLRKLGKDWNLSDGDIDRIIDESFRFLEENSCLKVKKKNTTNWLRTVIKFTFCLSVLVLLVYFCYTHRKVAHNFVEQNIQEIIYPGMKLIRKIMLPIIQTFPSLTEWYDEVCLVGNPYFQVSDIECWPCENVRSILNLTTSNLESDEYHAGIPFIYRDHSLNKVLFEDVSNMYVSKRDLFEREGGRLEDSRWSGWSSPEKSLLIPLQTSTLDNHITWKLNRLEATRAVRNLFGHIKRLPLRAAGPTPEKFILMDEESSPPYQLVSIPSDPNSSAKFSLNNSTEPATEGTNVFIAQGSGSRLLLLNPSPECSSTCHRVSIVLPSKHILWFNWWYWRAVSVPLHRNEGLSVAYMGSYY